MVSYSGHVPRSKEIMGTSTKGGLPPFAKEGVPLGQGTEFVTKPKPASTTIMDIAGKKMAMSNAAGKAWIEKNDPYTTTADRVRPCHPISVSPFSADAHRRRTGLGVPHLHDPRSTPAFDQRPLLPPPPHPSCLDPLPTGYVDPQGGCHEGTEGFQLTGTAGIQGRLQGSRARCEGRRGLQLLVGAIDAVLGSWCQRPPVVHELGPSFFWLGLGVCGHGGPRGVSVNGWADR